MAAIKVPVQESWRLVFRSTFTLYIAAEFRVIYYAVYKGSDSQEFYFCYLDEKNSRFIGFSDLELLLDYIEVKDR